MEVTLLKYSEFDLSISLIYRCSFLMKSSLNFSVADSNLENASLCAFKVSFVLFVSFEFMQ